MEKLSQTDIVFDELKDDDIIYKSGKRKGDPEFIRFHVRRTVVGENHLSKDKNTDIAATLNERYKQNSAQQNRIPVEGDIFAHVHQPTESRPVTDMGQGTDKWKAFCKLVIGDAEKSLISRISFVGMKNGRFCVECSDDDFEMIRKLGIEEKAKEFFDCKGSFAPVFYRG